MAHKLDKIHFNLNTILGYNLPFNFIISEREAGKSTATWLWLYANFESKGTTAVIVRRKVVHITKSYIDDIAKVINKFRDDKIKFSYSLSTLKDGIVDVYVNDKFFIRVIGLSADITIFKSGMVDEIGCIVFDEFICNRKFGEKYLKDEATKYMEVYNTFRREAKNLRCIFLGNPYSLFNPYFVFFGVKTALLKRGSIITDKKSYVIQCYELTPELRAKILEENPLYQFDNSYTRYAFEGKNIADENIQIREFPNNFSLFFVFGVEGNYVALYRNNDYLNLDYVFYARIIPLNEVSKRRNIYVFDLEDLVERTVLLSSDERYKFSRLKTSVRNRSIAFESIECYYMFEEIYNNL